MSMLRAGKLAHHPTKSQEPICPTSGNRGRSVIPSVSRARDMALILFFFQAEGGIRDYKVTGVQTCALPISVYQGHLARNLPPVVAELLPGFASDAQRALQFVRSTPGIGTALVGMKSTAHVEENAAVARRPPTPWSDFQRLFSAAGGGRLGKIDRVGRG